MTDTPPALDSAGAVSPFLWPYLGHEMAHYYFGTLLRGRGPYSWFLVESLAEYLSLQVVRHFQGESAFRERLAPYAGHAAADTASVPFDRIVAAEQLHDRYRYEYAPLLLVALEEAAGAPTMRRWLASLLREPERAWDYQGLRDAALAAGVAPETRLGFEAACVRPSFATGCLARR